MTFDEIISQIKNKQFKPLYLLMGEESFYIDKIDACIEENVMDEADRDFNQAVLYGGDTDVDTVIDNAKQYPFGVPYRLVIVREAQMLKDIQKLASYAENPSPTTILVLCYKYGSLKAKEEKKDKKEKAEKKDETKKPDLLQCVKKNGVVFESKKIPHYDIRKWIEQNIHNYGFSINSKASGILAEHIGEDLSLFDGEMQKLKIFLPEQSEITPDVIERYIGISKEYNYLEYQEALGNRDLNKVYTITYNYCQHQKENPNTRTLNVLFSFYFQLLAYHLDPVKSNETMADYFGKNQKIYWKKIANAKKYTLPELKNIISLLREYDVKVKGVDTSASQEDLLKELIYKILH